MTNISYKKILLICLFIFKAHLIFAQYPDTHIRPYIKVEGSQLRYYTTTLAEQSHDFRIEQSGMQINAVWGWDFDEKRYLGLGAGFLNFKDIKGASAFGEANFFVSNSYVNPYIGGRLGYSIVKPDQMDIHGDILAEFIAGLQVRFDLYSYFALYFQTGFTYHQKTLFVPLTVGFKL